MICTICVPDAGVCRKHTALVIGASNPVASTRTHTSIGSRPVRKLPMSSRRTVDGVSQSMNRAIVPPSTASVLSSAANAFPFARDIANTMVDVNLDTRYRARLRSVSPSPNTGTWNWKSHK
jgi:hypothetical protein